MNFRLSPILSPLNFVRIAGFFALSTPLCAQTINWGNTLSSTNVDSQGSALDASYKFEFGIFLNGFDPLTGSITQWDENWLALDKSPYSEGTGLFQDTWPEPTSKDPDDVDPRGPQQAEIEGQQAYIWVFNNQNADTSSEYGLFTNAADWVIPVFDGSQGSLAEEWRIAAMNTPTVLEANEIIFGGMYSVQGDGDFDPGGTPVTFDIQTHKVPEPEVSLVFGVVGILLIFRRRLR